MTARLSAPARLLVFLSDRFPPADLSRYGDESAYFRWQMDNARSTWNAVFASVADLRGRRVVDLGCGMGGKTAFYATLAPGSAIGIDCDEASIRQAERLAAPLGLDCRFHLRRAEDTGLETGSVDVLLSDDAFEHYPDPAAVLAEGTRVLREGGLFLVTFTTYWGPSGPHLYNWIRLPWAHLFFGWDTMEQAVRAIAARHGDAATHAGWETPAEQAEREIHQLRHFINKMSVRRFKRLLREQHDLELVTWHRFVGSSRGLPFVALRNLPVVEELGGHLFAALRKRTGARIRRRDFWTRATRADLPRVVRTGPTPLEGSRKQGAETGEQPGAAS